MSWPAMFAGATLVFSLLSVGRYFGAQLANPAAASLLLVLSAAAAVGAGRTALNAIGLGALGEVEKSVVGGTLGLGAMSLGVFALAAAGWLAPGASGLMLGAFLLLGYAEARKAVMALSRARLRFKYPLAAAAAALVLVLLFWTAWVPVHQYDSLVYHLAMPKAYLRAQGFTRMDYLLYSHFPQNGEMLFTLALGLGSESLASMLMWLATALTLAWLCLDAGLGIPMAAVWVAVLMLATHGAVMLLSSTTYVEPLVMLWITAAVLSFARWSRDQERPWLVLSAVFSGLALGAKYYAGISAALLGLWALARGRRRDFALFVAVTAAVFSPWLIKNALTVGNPVFPFLYRLFPMSGTGWNAATAEGYFRVLTEYGHRGSYLSDLLYLPTLLLQNSLRFGGGMDVLGDLGWDITFWCLPLGFWAARGHKFLGWLSLYCAAYLAAWFMTGVVLRFLTVIAPLLCLLGAYGLHQLWARLGPAGRIALGASGAAFAALHLLLFAFVHGVFGSERYLLGLEDREEFLSRRLEYYPCAAWAREHLPMGEKTLIAGEQRGYYVEQEQVATTVHAPNLFVEWANDAPSPAGLAQRLAQAGFRHILFVPREAARLGAGMGAFTALGARNWAALLGEARKRFQAPGCAVYSIR